MRCLPPPASGYSSANARRQPIENLVRFFSVFGDWNRIEKDCDACVGRREFNYTGNGGVLKLLKCAKNCVQCLLRRIIESLAHTNDQSGISEGNDFHHSVIPSEVEESRGAADGISTGSFDFAALRSGSQMLDVICLHSPCFASISMLIATVWLIPETDSAAGANIKLKSRRVIGSVVTAQRVRVVSLSGVSSFT